MTKKKTTTKKRTGKKTAAKKKAAKKTASKKTTTSATSAAKRSTNEMHTMCSDNVMLAAALNAAVPELLAFDDDRSWGTRKVFISAAANCVASRYGFPQRAFLNCVRDKIAELNRLGLIWASRADLVSAMPIALVQASEVEYGNATFHFIELKK